MIECGMTGRYRLSIYERCEGTDRGGGELGSNESVCGGTDLTTTEEAQSVSNEDKQAVSSMTGICHKKLTSLFRSCVV